MGKILDVANKLTTDNVDLQAEYNSNIEQTRQLEVRRMELSQLIAKNKAVAETLLTMVDGEIQTTSKQVRQANR